MTEHARAVLGLNVTPFMRGLAKAKTGMGKFKTAMQSSLGFFGIGFGLATLGRSITNFADKLIDTSRKLGVSTDFLQAWNHAAQQNGVSVNASNMALQRFTRRIGEAARGQGVLAKTMQELGIKMRDSDGNMRATTDVLADYADAVKGAESQQERLRLAFQAFDSEGAALVTLLQNGSDGMKQMILDAHRLGVITEQKALKSINRLSNKLKQFGTQALGFVSDKLGKFIDQLERGFAALGAFSTGVGLDAAMDIANAQVDAKNAADEMRSIQQDNTAELQKQVELEQKRVSLMQRQMEARQRLRQAVEDQSRTTVEELSERDINSRVRQHIGIQRARAQRFAMLSRLARSHRSRAEHFQRIGNTEGARENLNAAELAAQQARNLHALFEAGQGVNINSLREAQREARVIRAHEQEGRRLALLGLRGASDQHLARAAEMRRNMPELTAAERNPMANLERAVATSNRALEELNDSVGNMNQNLQTLNQ